MTRTIGFPAAALLLILAGCAQPAAPPQSHASQAAPAPAAANNASNADSAPAASPPAPAADAGDGVQPVYRELRDFTVACDNARHCEVIGAVDGAPGLVLTLRRDAGAAGAQSLVLAAVDGSLVADRLRLDDAPVPAIVSLPWQRDADDPGMLHLDAAGAIARFIDAARDGQRLSDGSGDEALALSLSGFSAALLLVDDVQQRLDTRGAWSRRGARSDDDVPRAPRLPALPPPPPAAPPLSDADEKRLTAAVRKSQAALLKTEDCNPQDGSFDIASGDSAEPLDASQALVFVTCLNGAYQQSSLLFRAPRDGRGAATRIVLPALRFDTGGGADAPNDSFAMLTNAGYDAATATLSHYAKGRGIADCGDSASWRYDGKEFRLAEYAQLRRCGGQPGEWPTLWRAADATAASR